jgi:hypothetical protein
MVNQQTFSEFRAELREIAGPGWDDLASETVYHFTVLGRGQQRGSKQASLIPKRGGGFVEKNGRPMVVARDDERTNPKPGCKRSNGRRSQHSDRSS